MSEEFSEITVHFYAKQALASDQRSGSGTLTFALLGLFGETGSLLSEVKKKQRDKASYLGYSRAVVEELGDVLWYLTVVADRGKLPLEGIFGNLKSADFVLPFPSDSTLTFASLQPAHMPIVEPSPALEKALMMLAGQVGRLVIDSHEQDLISSSLMLAHRLIEIAKALTEAANEARVSLEAAAFQNLVKISDRWPSKRTYLPALDASAPLNEQFPRKFCIEIFEREVRGCSYVYQRCNGLNIGDRLTDNAAVADDYRFHDVFHYAYVAVLGWSPVMRDLFRLKRKSDPEIDEVEDGARAILIEEGVTTWIFSRASKLDFFKSLDRGGLPFDMLKHVQQFVEGYEVHQSPLWLWEDAILQGYDAFRFLQKHRRGRLNIDLTNHSLTIEHLP